MVSLKKRSSPPPSTDPIGELAGEYRLLRKIGAGGFGTVYEAEHPVLKRKAAVKVLHANPLVESLAVKRFLEEARSASQIRHRHIVDIFSFGTLANGQYFYVMDLLDGVALDRYIRLQGRLAPELALPLLRRVAQAIDALHAASIIHRDVKPANIFLAWESSGEVVPKLLDFGLVKLLGNVSMQTASGMPIGTPYYMSPEQCRGESVDGHADVYSFGVICHELLTGQVPFDRDSAAAVLLAHLIEPPPRMSEVCPELSPDLDEPVLHMLAKDPKARPDSASAAVLELTLAAQGAGVTLADSLPWLPRPAPEALAEPPAPSVDDPSNRGTDPGSGTRRRSRIGRGAIALAVAGLLLSAGMAMRFLAQRGASSSPQGAVATTAPATAGPAALPSTANPGQAPTSEPSQPQTPDPASGAARLEAQAAPAVAERAATTPTADAHGAAPAASGTAEAAATAPTTTAPNAATADRVPLMLRGAPAATAVMLGDEKLGETPGPIRLPRGDQVLRLRVVAPGYGAKVIRLTPNRPLEMDGTLDRAKRDKAKGGALRDLEDPF